MVTSQYPALVAGHFPSRDGIYVITPCFAAWILEVLNTHNRKLRPSVVRRYARDMTAGRWLLTHQGVAFAAGHVLVDGQHRLAAVVESGASVVMRVFLNVPLATQAVVDDMEGRSVADRFNLAGDQRITHTHVAVAAIFYGAPRSSIEFSLLTKQERMDFILLHLAAIQFGAGCFPSSKKHITVAPVLGAIARAFACSPSRDDELRMFAHILFHNQTSGDHNADTVLKFRSFLTDSPSSYRGAHGQMVVYQKAQRVIRAYLDGEVLSKCYGTTTDLFPIPKDDRGGKRLSDESEG